MKREITSYRAFIAVTGIVLAVVSSCLSAAPADSRRVLNSNHPDRVQGHYQIVFHDDAEHRGRKFQGMERAQLRQTYREIAAEHSIEVRNDYMNLYRGFSGHMPEARARAFLSDPRVKSVRQAVRFKLTGTQSNAPWHLDRVDQRDANLDGSFTYSNTASNAFVYVFDTGIRASHNEFDARVLPGFSALNSGDGRSDVHGHGTAVAGMAGSSTYGSAKEVNIVPVQVCDQNENCDTLDIVAGMDWVIFDHATNIQRRGYSVANMSFAGSSVDGYDQAFDQDVKDFISQSDVVVVAGAGQSNADACIYSPARIPEVITVAMTDSGDRRGQVNSQAISNYGSCVDLYAPGEGIVTTANAGDTATDTWNGTSFASPLVAGRVAMMLDDQQFRSAASIEAELTGYKATHNRVINAQESQGTPNKLLHIGNSLDSPSVWARFETCSGGHLSRPIYTILWNGDYGSETENYTTARKISGVWGNIYSGSGTNTMITVDNGEVFALRSKYAISQGTSPNRVTGNIVAPNCSGISPY